MNGIASPFLDLVEKQQTTNLLLDNWFLQQGLKNKISDGKEGASLVIPASSQSSFAPMDIPFTLNESARNIIVRVQGASGTPDYILILPDGTEVTPTNAESLGYLATTYEEDNKAFYILQNTPVRRFGKAEEIADWAIYLASNEADYITGQNININGGLVMV